MWQYIIRRLLYAIPILLGVNIITFLLFFVVNTPDDMAYMQLGGKHIRQEDITAWKAAHGYDLPLFFNAEEKSLTKTIFWQKSMRLFAFDFGNADNGRNINQAIVERYAPSLAIAIPVLILGVILNIVISLMLALFRGGIIDILGVIICVILMSISTLFYIIMFQVLIAKVLRWLPISGYVDGFWGFKFLLLPIIVSIISGIGSSSRWYRAIFLEEMQKDYVRTARSKGLTEAKILYKHVLRNALIPILTGIVVILPLLFLGSLLTEPFFAIPGLGSYTIDAINTQDFSIVRAMVFLGSCLYILGLILTDISYVLVDPRIKLN